MPNYVDLHCHWLPGVDDGAPSLKVGLDMLRGLGELGFALVVATPHMRPGLFDNERDRLSAVFQEALIVLERKPGMPRVELACEHYFDDVVLGRIQRGAGLPYPGGKALLLEFYDTRFPLSVDQQLAGLRRRGLLPVIAHPERYQVVWQQPEVLERLLDVGAAALLDVAALAGRYGRAPRRCAESLLEAGLYHAACSDAHRSQDLVDVRAGMDLVVRRFGQEELDFLFRDGPLALLAGAIPK